MKKTIFTLVAVFTLSSCNDEKIEFRQDLPVELYVEVGETKLSKTVTDIDGGSTKIAIGLLLRQFFGKIVLMILNSMPIIHVTKFQASRCPLYPCPTSLSRLVLLPR